MIRKSKSYCVKHCGKKESDTEKIIKACREPPDIVITKYKIAIFCDGDFFHGKDWEVLKPRLQKGHNSEYWISKISRNKERDDEVNKQLLFMGWTVIRFWGDEIQKHLDECIKVVEETIFDIITQADDLTEDYSDS